MKKKTRSHQRSAGQSLNVISSNSLVGTWEQEPDPGGTTTVAYTIRVEQGRFVVLGKDEEDGIPLEASRVKWDGKSLHFTTVFPPTGHKSKHVLTALSKNRMKHLVSCIYADGEVFYDNEFWRKRRGRKKEVKTRQR